MKEASGELSMTAVAVVAIAAIGVLFSTLIWPSIKANITRSANCSQAFNCTGTGKMLSCEYCKDEKCEKTTPISCPNQDYNADATQVKNPGMILNFK